MEQCSPLGCFVKEWTCYLELHGHRVMSDPRAPDLLRSRNPQGKRYRWMIRCEAGNSVFLSEADCRTIRCHLRAARKASEQCFLVVKFGYPAGTALIIPASKAQSIRLLVASKGGIPWES
jgi:hypothetical protein